MTLPPTQDSFTGEERLTRARYSIPYFVAPDVDAVVEVMKECASQDNPVKYDPVTQGDYSRMRAKLQYPEKDGGEAK